MEADFKILNPSEPPSIPGPVIPVGRDIVMLPAWMDGDEGVYAEQAVAFVKEMRESGVTIDWQQEGEKRQWYGKRSAVVDLVAIPLVLGIASSAGWDAIKKLFGSRKGRAHLKIVHWRDQDGSEGHWIELEGDAQDIVRGLERLNPWSQREQVSPPDGSTDDE